MDQHRAETGERECDQHDVADEQRRLVIASRLHALVDGEGERLRAAGVKTIGRGNTESRMKPTAVGGSTSGSKAIVSITAPRTPARHDHPARARAIGAMTAVLAAAMRSVKGTTGIQ